ncbi:uncharacterized protein LOC131232778 isoform X2 [Magnolia sinica]|uniref:uncharacterized protein LOC131232778 isoform X2 n=1 Tax=Magnolia sinica TaxID=86752 RepID=UPI0026585F64|nr:uncharacterized protein LOC131232778 isoform X2 [Magnolia sinica]
MYGARQACELSSWRTSFVDKNPSFSSNSHPIFFSAMSERSFSPSSSVSEEGEEKPERSRKRRRDRDSDEDLRRDTFDLRQSLLLKRSAKPHDVLFRIVVPSRQIGRVIGKEGSQIRRIREETRATIKIADAVSRHEERVIIISSRDDDSTISDAEYALYNIARVILKENDDGAESSKVGAGHVAANMIRLLIAGSQAGCLIGVSGQNIEKIRNSSGAAIMILAQNQLPSCASAHESDRLVQVSGNVPEVLKALENIGYTLRENPPKKVIAIRPTYNISSANPNPSYPALSSAELVTSEMMISESLVGGLIGKHGSNISKIRSESGATIKVTGGKGEQEQRQIHFGGSSQQVALAKTLVERYIYSQIIQQGSS